MILSDHEITQFCQNDPPLVTPFDPSLVNPASIDVRLGNLLLIESAQSPVLVPYPLSGHTEEDPYLLVPGQFCLAPTVETFNVPDCLAAEFRLKSSRAREGLDQALAVWADPGFHGSVLTLELRNNRQLWPQLLWPGMKIGQMVFHRMSRVPELSYAVTGRYCNDTTVQASKG
jgi:dCTP deaminase